MNENLHHNYFSIIDTEAKAYWLGFLVADGHIEQCTENSWRLSVTLKDTDIEHLEKLKKALNADNQVSVYKRKDSRLKAGYSSIAQFKVSSKQLTSDLAYYSVSSQKFKINRLPYIREDLQRHLIRGYIDGDGWIRKRCASIGFCTSRLHIKNYIVPYIKANDIRINVINESNRYNTALYNCNVDHVKDARKLMWLLYHDATVYLDRKKELVDKHLLKYCPPTE